MDNNPTALTLEMLSIERIKAATGPDVFDQGLAYFTWGRAQITKLEAHHAQCIVLEARRYEVTLSATEKFLYLKCTCEQGNKKVICKHQVAAYLAVRERLLELAPVHWSDNLNRVLETRRAAARPSTSRKYFLVFSLQGLEMPTYTNWKLVPYTLPLQHIPKELHPETGKADAAWLANLLVERPGITTHLKTPYQMLAPENCLNAGPPAVLLANLIIERTRTYSYYTHTMPVEDHLELLQSAGAPLFGGSAIQPAQQLLRMPAQPAQLKVQIAKDEQGIHLNAFIEVEGERLELEGAQEDLDLISLQPLWLLYDNHVLRLENACSPDLLQTWLEVRELNIPLEEEQEFLERYYLRLVQELPVESDLITWDTLEAPVRPRLYLNDAKGKLQATLRFAYGDLEVGYQPSLPEESIQRQPDSWNLIRVQRDTQAEANAYQILSSSQYRLKRAPKPAPPGDFMLRANAQSTGSMSKRWSTSASWKFLSKMCAGRCERKNAISS
jgi:non-specific serine/threonine protein kinase